LIFGIAKIVKRSYNINWLKINTKRRKNIVEKKTKVEKKYFKIKTKSLPRVSFAVTTREVVDRQDRIENNNYIVVRYVDAGKIDVTFEGEQKRTLSAGE